MAVEVNNLTKAIIDIRTVKKIANQFLVLKRLTKKEVSIAFVGDARIRELNRTYRKINKATDVLSFAGEADFLGEIIIDYRQIERQALLNFGQKPKRGAHLTGQAKKAIKMELIFVLVHGLLHLVGYNDDTEKKRLRMIKIGEEFIKILKY